MPPPPTNVTFSNGSKPTTSEIGDDNNDSLIDHMGNIIEGLYESAKDNFNELLNCPGGKRRGWKILDGGSPVEFAPCGCYDDALWPMVLGVPAAAKAGAGMTAKILAKKARKKWTREAIKQTKEILDILLQDYYRGLKLLNNSTVYLKRKLPPVPSGYTRLYRGQGARRLQKKVNGNLDLDSPSEIDIDNPVFDTPFGKYWTDEPGYADRFARTNSGMATNDSQIFYIDVPTSEANRTKLGGLRNGTVNDLGMLPGQKYPEEIPGSRWNWELGEFEFGPDGRMPLRRRNSNGVIEIVEDIPQTSDLDLNPGVFATNEQSANFEYYLDSSLYNTNYVENLTRETNLAQESVSLAFQDLKDKTRKILDKQEELESLLNNPNSSDSTLIKLVSEIENTGANLNNSIDRYFDKYEASDLGMLNQLKEKSTSWLSYITYFVPWFLGLLAFIDRIMSLVSIVKDKSCIPLMEGGLSEFSNKSKMAQIRNQRIANKTSVWAELNPETCECSECPGDWSFCDHSSITNLYLKETNSCIPPCCGGQELKPITLIETCKCDCPEGQVFMPCECSDCSKSDSLLTSLFNPSKPGKCVDPNPDPEKLEWNPQSCSWECKNYSIEYPSYSFGTPVKKPLPKCEKDGVRKPTSCECSGSYKIEPCVSESLQSAYNIVPITEIRIM